MIAENPDRQEIGIVKLSGREECRIRVGDYRVIYSVDGIVLAVSPCL